MQYICLFFASWALAAILFGTVHLLSLKEKSSVLFAAKLYGYTILSFVLTGALLWGVDALIL